MTEHDTVTVDFGDGSLEVDIEPEDTALSLVDAAGNQFVVDLPVEGDGTAAITEEGRLVLEGRGVATTWRPKETSMARYRSSPSSRGRPRQPNTPSPSIFHPRALWFLALTAAST
jgi:hypothetical protein